MPQTGFVLWLTGLSGAGKTTIAHHLEAELKSRDRAIEVLDGDIIRTQLCQGLGFSRIDRETNIRRIGFVAHLLGRNGVGVIVSAISPYRDLREELRQTIPNFIEVYVNAPIDVCEARDVKGLYAKARAGEIKAFTGIDSPYEVPTDPDVVCYTAEETLNESVAKITRLLEQRSLISSEASLLISL